MFGDYVRGVEQLRLIHRGFSTDRPTIINLGERGFTSYGAHHKLGFWLPKGTRAYKLRLGSEMDYNTNQETVVWPWAVKNSKNQTIIPGLDSDIGLGLSNISACWAKPGSAALHALFIPGTTNFDQDSMFNNLAKYGIIVDKDPKSLAKAFKRLKRALTVKSYGSTSNFNVNILTDPSEAPKTMTDGMAFGRLSLLKRMFPKRDIQNNDCVMFSYAGPEGIAKGTLAIKEDLSHDLVIPGLHNIKTEVKFTGCDALNTTGKRLLSIEQFHTAIAPTTDIQTMINIGMIGTFNRALDAQCERLKKIATEIEFAEKCFEEDFDDEDWYLKSLERREERGLDIEDFVPDLALARAAGLKLDLSNKMHLGFFRHNRKRIDLRGIKCRIPESMGQAGYLVPDLSQFNNRGEFSPNSNCMKPGEIAFPSLSEGDVVAYRQPNSWGEVVKAKNVQPNQKSRMAVQINCFDTETWLATFGGGDFDDRVIGIRCEHTLNDFNTSEKLREESNIKRIKLESYIDGAVQDARGYKLTLNGQASCALSTMPMELGQIINFVMNLRITNQPKWYKLVEACTSLNELKTVYENYHHQYDINGKRVPAKLADIFCPINLLERDRYARWPLVPEFWKAQKMGLPIYEPFEMVKTELGSMISAAQLKLNEITGLEKTAVFHGKLIQNMEFLRFLDKIAPQETTDPMLNEASVRAYDIYCAFAFLFSNLDPKLVEPEVMELLEPRPIDNQFPDLTLRFNKWGRVINALYSAKHTWDKHEFGRAITAYLACHFLVPKERFSPEFGRCVQFGTDKMLWTVAKDSSYTPVENMSMRDYWVQLLQMYNESQQPASSLTIKMPDKQEVVQ